MNEVKQFCVRWVHPTKEGLMFTVAIAVLDNGACEVVSADHSMMNMRAIAERAAQCVDGSLKVKGKNILPETYCALWRKVFKGVHLTPSELHGQYAIECKVVAGSWDIKPMKDLARALGHEEPEKEGDSFLVDMLKPGLAEMMLDNYGIERLFRYGHWAMRKLENGLFSMKEAA